MTPPRNSSGTEISTSISGSSRNGFPFSYASWNAFAAATFATIWEATPDRKDIPVRSTVTSSTGYPRAPKNAPSLKPISTPSATSCPRPSIRYPSRILTPEPRGAGAMETVVATFTGRSLISRSKTLSAVTAAVIVSR